MRFEFDVQNFQKIKLSVHIAQSIFILFSWILEIVVLRRAAHIDGRPGWFFGVCFLSIPALIFLTMTPRFPRTRKFANPYALATVDGVWVLLWLSAFAAQASFNATKDTSKKDDANPDAKTDVFKCSGACGASKAIVGLGVVVWLLWIVTAFMSFYGVMYYNRDGYLPGASRAPYNAQQIDPDKEAFSTAPHDDEYARINNDEHEIPDRHDSSSGRYGAGPSGSVGSRYEPDTPGVKFSGGYVAPQVHDEPTGYTGYSGAAGGRAQFPDGRYEHV